MSGIDPGLPYDVLDGELVPWETPTRRGPSLQQRVDAAKKLREAYRQVYAALRVLERHAALRVLERHGERLALLRRERLEAHASDWWACNADDLIREADEEAERYGC